MFGRKLLQILDVNRERSVNQAANAVEHCFFNANIKPMQTNNQLESRSCIRRGADGQKCRHRTYNSDGDCGRHRPQSIGKVSPIPLDTIIDKDLAVVCDLCESHRVSDPNAFRFPVDHGPDKCSFCSERTPPPVTHEQPGQTFGAALARIAPPPEDELLAYAYDCLENFRGSAIELAAVMETLQSKGYSVKLVAEHCDMSYSTVRGWMRSGRVHRVPAYTYDDC